MTYEEAIEILKRGGRVSRDGKTYELRRGIQDVTDPEAIERVYMTDELRAASDWEIAEGPHAE